MSITLIILFFVLHLQFHETAPSVGSTASSSTLNLSDAIKDVKIECNSNEIELIIETFNNRFNGMIYPKGLSRNSSCLSEMIQTRSPVHYKLPLRSCNTMSQYLDDGSLEYYNTIMVQPHLKLVTNQGRGFHVRCKYDVRDNIIINDQSTFGPTQPKALISEPLPIIGMKILSGNMNSNEIAKNVRIGDPLTLSIETLDYRNVSKYGLQVVDCSVRDGIGLSEQKLINHYGCPYDNDIMGVFRYFNNFTKAMVPFQAHKFPYTKSVYYECHVRLCETNKNHCHQLQENNCKKNPSRKIKRQILEETPAVIEVYSGLFVNEEPKEDEKSDFFEEVFSEKTSNAICISQRKFAIGMVIIGLILMLIAIIAILCIISKRTRKPISRTGSSIYSGPYTNTSYSHTS